MSDRYWKPNVSPANVSSESASDVCEQSPIKSKFGNKGAALYLVGGGLESASSAGMLAAIEKLAWQNQDFSMILGASAGSFMAAYFLTGRAVQGAAGYWKVLPQFIKEKKYFNPFGPLQGRAFIDMPMIVSELFSKVNPVCWKSAIEHPMNQCGKFYIQVMCAHTGNVFYLHKFQSERALTASVTGSCWIPLLAGIKPFRLTREVLDEVSVIDGHGQTAKPEFLDVFDGHIADPYFEQARQIFSQPYSLILDPLHPDRYDGMDAQFGPNLKWFERYTALLFFRQYPQALSRYIQVMLEGEVVSQAWRTYHLQNDSQATVRMIHPDQSVLIQTYTESRQDIFRQKVISGWNGCFKTLEIESPELPEDWAA